MTVMYYGSRQFDYVVAWLITDRPTQCRVYFDDDARAKRDVIAWLRR